MSTTLLFAELLIIGVQAGIWLLLLVLNLTGLDWLQRIQFVAVADWQALIVVILLSLLYVLGIIVDRVADSIFSRWEFRITIETLRELKELKLPLVVLRFATSKDDEHLNHQYEYNRSRMRITRASSVNFALITVFALSLIFVHGQSLPDALKWRLSIVVFILGTLLTFAAVYSWRKLMRGYVGMVRDNYLHRSQKEIPMAAQKTEGGSQKPSGAG